jgi:hypothetical protein
MAHKTTSWPEFYSACFKRAFRGKFGQIDLVSGILSLFAVPLGLKFLPWLLPEWTEGGIVNWIPLGIFGAVLAGTVVVGLITAPYWIYNELEAEKNSLAARLDNREARQHAIARLWQLRAEGVPHRNKGITAEEQEKWAKEYEDWRSRVLAEAGVVSANFQAWLTILDRVRPGPAPSVLPTSNEHASLRNIMSEILLRMQEFLQADMLRRDIDSFHPEREA